MCGALYILVEFFFSRSARTQNNTTWNNKWFPAKMRIASLSLLDFFVFLCSSDSMLTCCAAWLPTMNTSTMISFYGSIVVAHRRHSIRSYVDGRCLRDGQLRSSMGHLMPPQLPHHCLPTMWWPALHSFGWWLLWLYAFRVW